MIPAIVSLMVMALVAVSLWEIVSGIFDITIGLFMMISGAFLYCLSFPVEFLGRAVRILRRSF